MGQSGVKDGVLSYIFHTLLRYNSLISLMSILWVRENMTLLTSLLYHDETLCQRTYTISPFPYELSIYRPWPYRYPSHKNIFSETDIGTGNAETLHPKIRDTFWYYGSHKYSISYFWDTRTHIYTPPHILSENNPSFTHMRKLQSHMVMYYRVSSCSRNTHLYAHREEKLIFNFQLFHIWNSLQYSPENGNKFLEWHKKHGASSQMMSSHR